MSLPRQVTPSEPLDLVVTAQSVLHARADDGQPVTVPDPGTEHGRRLLHTLGADTTVTMTLAEYVELLDRAEGTA